MQRLLLCATALATADARLALSVDSHTTLVVTPERVYESAASLAIIDAADSAVSDISGISTVDTKSVGFGAAGTTFSNLPQGTFVAVLVDGAGGVLAITRAFDVSCSGEIDDSDYHLEWAAEGKTFFDLFELHVDRAQGAAGRRDDGGRRGRGGRGRADQEGGEARAVAEAERGYDGEDMSEL